MIKHFKDKLKEIQDELKSVRINIKEKQPPCLRTENSIDFSRKKLQICGDDNFITKTNRTGVLIDLTYKKNKQTSMGKEVKESKQKIAENELWNKNLAYIQILE